MIFSPHQMTSSSLFIGIVTAAIVFFFTLLGSTLFMFYRKTKYHHQKKQTDSPSPSSIPSPSSTLSTLPLTLKHDVFPSFRGEDVRRDFLSHIQKEFQRKGITAFIDNNIERGESIAPELIRAIRGSKIAVVLLSQNYASSSWCLDELVEIMKCREELGLKVIAVFYKVDPSHVKKLTGDFGKVFKKTCKGKKTEKIETWREAFAKVATIAGYDSSQWNNEAEMIEKIAGEISKMLCHSTPSRDFDGLIGMGAHMEKIEELLCSESDEVRMIGIWGPSGIGKTTIARFLFSKRSQDFNLSVFMDVKAIMYTRPPSSDDYPLKLHLHQQLISQILDQKDIEILHLGVAEDRLKDKKVLVVLDGVDRSLQLEAMAKETRWFGPGSRIVITTQDTRLLMRHGIERIYKVDFPTSEEALQLFCINAFGQNSPKDGFEELAQEVTYRVGLLPLGLKVMGSYFKNMCKQDWIQGLARLRTHLDSDIQSILKFSYDALDAEDKDLFLHIACFFEFYETPMTVERCLEKNFSDVRHGIRVLTDKSLISIEDGYVEMHSLLVQLGREIVRKQSIGYPGQHRLMLVNAKETCEVVTDDAASRSVLGIHFWLNETENELNISEKAFNGFSNLQFLRFSLSKEDVHILSDLKNLPRRLRFLKWPYYPFTSLPSEFHTEFLVKLDLQHSELEKLWEGIQPLKNLVWMDLSHSKNLKELPDLSTATNLQILQLLHCSSLVELPFSIGKATSIVTLDLDYCSKLVELPSTFGNLQKLSKLTMRECSKLESLPTNINLESLKELNLAYCHLLKSFPQISSNIELLNLCKTAVEEVTSSIMPRLDQLYMSNCEKFKELPHAFASITQLILTGEETQELPAWFKRFYCLRVLDLLMCKKLVHLLHLPDSLQCLIAEDCESLETVDWPSHNSKFDRLDFRNCLKLNKEARELIIQASTRDHAFLPGIEVPASFTYRAIGDSVTVNLNGRPFPTPFRFKVCILLAKKAGVGDYSKRTISFRIMDKHNDGLTVMLTKRHIFLGSVSKDGHMCIFEDEAKIEVTSRELVFELKINSKEWDVGECGVKLQPMEDDERDQESK